MLDDEFQAKQWPEYVRRLSDRHFGIGSDGVILVCPSPLGAAFRMRMFNADGSEGEMCGNGLRCAVKFALDHSIVAADDKLTVETGRGLMEIRVAKSRGLVSSVQVDMGAPILQHSKIPAAIESLPPDAVVVGHKFDPARWSLSEEQVEPHITLVSMGNPHVILCCKIDPSKINLEAVGPVIETDPWFLPKRINVHLAFYSRSTATVVRTWERGSGITLACGTGASAVLVAGVLLGLCDRAITTRLPGGDLEIEWPSDDGSVVMTGPAKHVFSG